jgi:2-oxoglutarate ferredoxin oxidoreductase subunit alpha
MLEAPNILLFEDPTNHLDLESITALNEGMVNFKGNILFSSHDAELLETVANRIICFTKDGHIKDIMTTYEEFMTDDADIIITAFGSMTRNIKAAMKVLREQGIKAGCFRPVTLNPFPHNRINEIAREGKDFAVVEMNMGQMFKDVKYAVNGLSQTSLINKPCGEWLSVEEIVEAVEKIMEKSYAASI